jgi:Ca-activated chloride channel homolog
MGAGHTVTALFEVVPPRVQFTLPSVDRLKYQPTGGDSIGRPGEMLSAKVRYKEPDGNTSRLIEVSVLDRNVQFNAASDDFRFAAAVASFGMILRDSPHKRHSTLGDAIRIAQSSIGADRNGHRGEFIRLVIKAQELAR